MTAVYSQATRMPAYLAASGLKPTARNSKPTVDLKSTQ